jgi:hypothetical protein
MHIYVDKKEVLTLQRPYACYCPGISVFEPTSGEPRLLGKVQSKFACCSKEFSILDDQGQEKYHIHGPM